MTVDFGLTGQVAVVTGGGSGIGKAISHRLIASGAKVAVCDISLEAATAAAEELKAAGGEAYPFRIDVSDLSATAQLAEDVEAEVGPIDILVNCAGILTFGSALDESDEGWHRVLGVNLDGTFGMMKAILPRMVSRGSGSVVNVGSSFSARGSMFNTDGGSPSYCVSKAGVQALTRKAAYDVGPTGVRVNAIAPGTVDSPMHKANQDRIQSEVPSIPMGRLALPDDLAGAVLFLASDAASYITGQTLHVNGGKIMAD